MADAFRGYDFYMPAFIDFRGRIYQSGILHFHERDLARNLIIFSDPNFHKSLDIYEILLTASAFHFKYFKSIAVAQEWCRVVLVPALKKVYDFNQNKAVGTILVKDIHKPYAAGLMVVRPGKDITREFIDIYFCEDYSILSEEFEDRSDKVLYEMIHRIEALEEFKERSDKVLYEMIHRIEALGTLKELASNICPHLGEKKDMEHASLNEDNLKQNKEEIVEYLRHDVLLLGGHADAYIPFGENLYYYDVNSLYPFVLKEYPMPGGKAR
nr:DNA polymerase-like [Tanacetum cinerariifolium]